MLLLLAGLAVLDDDSGKLEEIVELFSDTTPHIKVDKLVKVRQNHNSTVLPCEHNTIYVTLYYHYTIHVGQ